MKESKREKLDLNLTERKHDNGEDVVMYKGEIKLRSELPLYAKVAAAPPVAPASNA